LSEPGPISLCIVNYNGLRHLERTLPAVLALADEFAEILLVDNASTDGSVAFVETGFPNVRIIRLDRNDGPGAARNAGVAAARTELVLFVDNDVVPEPGCARRLAEALAANPRAAVAAPRILYAHKPDIVQYDGADNHYLGLMILHHQDVPRSEADTVLRAVDGVVSAAFMVARSRLEGEGFDPSFFIYVEDHDFGLSLRAVGSYTRRRAYLLIRNRWLLILKNYDARSLLVLAPALLAFELAQLAIAAKKGWLPEWWSALRWIVDHRSEILAERRRIQAKRRLPDRALLRGGAVPFRAELTTSAAERLARRLFDGFAIAYWRVAAGLL
jgi:GT2 family glycosyltransferase